MELIIGAMQTPDGYWRVEVLREGGDRWYRVIHAATVVHDKAPMAVVQRILGDAYTDLAPVDLEPGDAA